MRRCSTRCMKARSLPICDHRCVQCSHRAMRWGLVMRLASIALVLSACHGGAPNPAPAPEPGTTHATAPAAKPVAPVAPAAPPPVAKAAAPMGSAAPAETPAPLAGANFIDD